MDVPIHERVILAEDEMHPMCPLQHFLPFPLSKNIMEMVLLHVLEGKSYIWETFVLT